MWRRQAVSGSALSALYARQPLTRRHKPGRDDRTLHRPSFARTKRGKSCPVHRDVQDDGRDTPMRSQRVSHHSVQQTRSESLRSSTTHSHHTKQATHNLPTAAATLSSPCCLLTCEHRPLLAFRTRLLAHTLGHFKLWRLAHRSREVPSQSSA